MIKHLEKFEDFENEIKEGIVLVDFYADWCGPCQMLSPNIEALEQETQIKVIKVDTDAIPELARMFGIMSIPTILLYKDGKLEKRDLGYKTIDELRNFIK